MSKWLELDLTAQITDLLGSVSYYRPDHPFGRPFLTAYQLAIALDAQDPSIRQSLSLPIGGKGTARETSFTQYLAGQLSQRIASGEISHIEGAFISNRHLARLVLRSGNEEIESSLTDTQYDLSMFRLAGAHVGKGESPAVMSDL